MTSKMLESIRRSSLYHVYSPRKQRLYRYICMTLNFEVNRQGHMIRFGLFEISDLENVEINTKIKSVACLQPEVEEVT